MYVNVLNNTIFLLEVETPVNVAFFCSPVASPSLLHAKIVLINLGVGSVRIAVCGRTFQPGNRTPGAPSSHAESGATFGKIRLRLSMRGSVARARWASGFAASCLGARAPLSPRAGRYYEKPFALSSANTIFHERHTTFQKNTRFS